MLEAGNAMGVKQLIELNPVVGAPKRGEKRFWTCREQKILRETYPRGGAAACLSLLPGRSAYAIYQVARKLRLECETCSSGHRRLRYASNEFFDAAIRRVYQAAPRKNVINELCRRLQRPRQWVNRRARILGCAVPRFKEPAWSEAEIAIISAAPHLSFQAQQMRLKRAGFRRTETAIAVKLRKLAIDRDDPDHATARGLALMFGVDCKTVGRWIEKGWLRARRRGTLRVAAQHGDHWWIARKDVRAFIIHNAHAVDIRRIDKDWLIDLLAKG